MRRVLSVLLVLGAISAMKVYLGEYTVKEALNFPSCGIKVEELKTNKFLVSKLANSKEQYLVSYERNAKGDVYTPGRDNYFHLSRNTPNPMNCLSSNEFSNGHIQIKEFDTKRWGVGDGVSQKYPPKASMFIFYGNNQQGDWGSMNKDAETMLRYARTNKLNVFGYVTNKHAKVTKETVATSKAQFRKWFQQFLSQKGFKDLIFTVSTHGLPYKYKNYNMDIQGEAILIGKDAYGRNILY